MEKRARGEKRKAVKFMPAISQEGKSQTNIQLMSVAGEIEMKDGAWAKNAELRICGFGYRSAR